MPRTRESVTDEEWNLAHEAVFDSAYDAAFDAFFQRVWDDFWDSFHTQQSASCASCQQEFEPYADANFGDYWEKQLVDRFENYLWREYLQPAIDTYLGIPEYACPDHES